MKLSFSQRHGRDDDESFTTKRSNFTRQHTKVRWKPRYIKDSNAVIMQPSLIGHITGQTTTTTTTQLQRINLLCVVAHCTVQPQWCSSSFSRCSCSSGWWRGVAVTRCVESATTLRRARLVLGWVTVYGQVNHLGTKPAS